MALSFCLLLSIVLIGGNLAVGNAENNTLNHFNKKQIEESFIKKLNVKCAQRENSSCIMLKLVTYLNRMLKKSSITINENIELTQTKPIDALEDSAEDQSLFARALGSEDATLSVILADKVWQFFRSRSLKWKAFDAADVVLSSDENGKIDFSIQLETQNLVEPRGKNKNNGHIIGAIIAKVALLGALIFKGLVLLVGKALIVSKLALLLASIIGLKKLLSKKHITYEVVAHPHVEHHEGWSGGHGWGRALEGFFDSFAENLANNVDNAQNMAFMAQKP